jgi:hypothetical protein
MGSPSGKTLQVALGELVVIGAAALVFFRRELDRIPADKVLTAAAVVCALGLALLANGIRNPIPHRDRQAIRRAVTPSNLLIGPAMIAACAGVLYLFHVIGFMPTIVVIGALIGIPAGVLVAASLFEYSCSHCQAKMKSGSVGRSSVLYCPACRALAVHYARGGPFVLRGDQTRALIEGIPEEKDGPTANGQRTLGAQAPSSPAPEPGVVPAAEPAPSLLAPALLCLLLGAGMVVYATLQTRVLPSSRRIWSEGVEATEVEIKGEVSGPHILSWMVPLYSYRLKSRFVDAQGTAHELDEHVQSYFSGSTRTSRLPCTTTRAIRPGR